MKILIIVTTVLITIAGCANRPESISASYISHEKYSNFDCLQLATRLGDTREMLHRFENMQNAKANGDAAWVLFFAIPMSKLTGDYEGDVAKWKGEMEAIETAQVKAECRSY